MQENREEETHFHLAVSCIAQALKTQIINTCYDEVAICFFNTREKKNLQDLNGVYVFNVAEREDLDRPTARLIKEFDCIEGWRIGRAVAHACIASAIRSIHTKLMDSTPAPFQEAALTALRSPLEYFESLRRVGFRKH
ncbi:ATP-dependent DNA helicase 2 subunit KU70 [Camellia lanceoleosa]|uniref:ATP-dependent DNA helicase 2 subunit KU70 n=1 Tax=Camellia lanceoleosa TaxID=1840588 RepID=A0ACC0FPB6_9ERIC|nr:ATP-dependent DNA helicase 2 subunit KU70 [Camellia lanceoleosa]